MRVFFNVFVYSKKNCGVTSSKPNDSCETKKKWNKQVFCLFLTRRETDEPDEVN